jgi:hypothetical protein
MYDGSLATVGPWEAIVTFQQLLILADRFGDVDMTPEVIARTTTVPVEIIRKGLAALVLPDPESRSGEAEGRRIELINPGRSWGWRIVNYARYAELRSAEDRRAYKRQWIRQKRHQAKRQKHPQLSTVDNVDDVGLSDSDSYSEADKDNPAGAGLPKGGRQRKASPKAARMVPETWQPGPKLLERIREEQVEECLRRGGTSVAMELERFRACTFSTARTDWDKTAWNWLLTECKQINQKEALYGANRQSR